MVIDRKECAKLLRENGEFLVLSHEHPDGDTLGSAFALCEILRLMGKKRAFLCCDKISADFSYMTDGFTPDEVKNPFIIAVDVADVKLLGSIADEYGKKVDLSIDHHLSNTYYAKNNFVEDRAAACEIIYELAAELGVEKNRYMRNCIYTGLSTDTGCFRYQNVTPSVFRVAASLAEDGVDNVKINKIMFETKTKSFLRLEMIARETLEYYFDGKCAVITITQDMFRKSGSGEDECYPITALPRQIEGVLVGAVIKEQKDGSFKVSVRTEDGIDASEICKRLNGGGHKGAAGANFGNDYNEGKKLLLESIKISLDGIE
ncbi:MAG: DHH family phosphoesterase [Clostridia bacterium]|nr:DHH family phosphoesterase [Clostridia bacterium]